jgi:hypothetical protein
MALFVLLQFFRANLEQKADTHKSPFRCAILASLIGASAPVMGEPLSGCYGFVRCGRQGLPETGKSGCKYNTA